MADDPRRRPSREELLDALRAVLEAVDVPHAATAGGQEKRDGILIDARMAPERVGALALWGVPMIEGDHSDRLAHEERPKFTVDYGEEIAAYWTRRWNMSNPAVAEWVNVRCMAEVLLCGLRRPDGHRAVGREDTIALARSVTRPVLAMCGSNEMLREETRLSTREFPDATLAEIRDLGLDAFDEAPEELAELMDRFFRAPRLGPVHAGRGVGADIVTGPAGRGNGASAARSDEGLRHGEHRDA